MPRKQAVAKQDTTPQPAPRTRTRTQPVRSTRQFLESAEQQVGQDRPRNMKSTGPARKSLEPAHIETVDNPVSKEFLDALAFNEEEIVVMVHDTTNPNDPPIVEVWNDGKAQRFIRGQEQAVKRKYVEVLARSKRTSYSQQKYKDDNGIEAYRNVPHTVNQYPFSVIRDSNPRGAAWLKGILAQA